MHMHFKVPNLLDSLSGRKKVVTGIAVIEGSVLAANVYFILHCSGFEDIDPQSSGTRLLAEQLSVISWT